METHGLEQVSFKDKADIYVLNSCSVTENADKEARKIIRRARRCNPDAAVAVIGCYAQLQPDEIAAIPGVELVVGACLLYTSPSPRDQRGSRMPSSA